MHPLQRYRIRSELSARQLAKRSKVAESTINKIEKQGSPTRHGRKVHVDIANKLAKALNMQVSELFQPWELTDQGGRGTVDKKVPARQGKVCKSCSLTIPLINGDICPECN